MCNQVELEVTKSTASHHFKTLHRAGITAEREHGVRKYIRLRRSELDARFPGFKGRLLDDDGQPRQFVARRFTRRWRAQALTRPQEWT